MGINAITCEGYGGLKESAFGKGQKSSSDFEGAYVLKPGLLLAATAGVALVAGCIEQKPPPAKVEYDKNSNPITIGRIDTDEMEHFSIDAPKGLLENGQPVGLRRIAENLSVDKDAPFDNVCRVKEYIQTLNVQHYDLNCYINPESDGIGPGDAVALYKVLEVQK